MSTDLTYVSSTDVALLFDSSILAGQLAPSSIRMYARDVRAHLAYARTPAAALDPATLARWRARGEAGGWTLEHPRHRLITPLL